MRILLTTVLFLALGGLQPASAGKIYWIADATNRIQRANLDGSHVEDVVIEPAGFDLSLSLALAPVAGKLFWTGCNGCGLTKWENTSESSKTAASFPSQRTLGESVEIRRANLDGSGEQVLEGVMGEVGLALHLPLGRLYYTNPSDCSPCGNIRRHPLGPGSSQIVYPTNNPGAITVDPTVGRMCWRASGFPSYLDEIWCSDLEGVNKQLVLEETGPRVQALALETGGDWLYWIDSILKAVRRVRIDGTIVETLVGGLDLPESVALDLASGKVYWSDSGSGKIQFADLDGSNVKDVLTDLDQPRGIALDLGQGAIELRLERDWLSWSQPAGAVSFQVVRGDLAALRHSEGDFSLATVECLGSPSASELIYRDSPVAGEGFWFLVRGVTLSGDGTYDVTHSMQSGFRDAEIAASGVACP